MGKMNWKATNKTTHPPVLVVQATRIARGGQGFRAGQNSRGTRGWRLPGCGSLAVARALGVSGLAESHLARGRPGRTTLGAAAPVVPFCLFPLCAAAALLCVPRGTAATQRRSLWRRRRRWCTGESPRTAVRRLPLCSAHQRLGVIATSRVVLRGTTGRSERAAEQEGKGRGKKAGGVGVGDKGARCEPSRGGR